MHTIEAKVGSRRLKGVSALVATGIALFAPSVSASTSYWAELINPDGMYVFKGDCTVCHSSLAGGAGTVTKPFGDNLMKQYGLGGADLAKFKEVMVQVAADGLDSDGDTATDIEEITAGGDPNDPAVLPGGFEAPVQAEYGCVGTIAGNAPATDGAALTTAAFVAVALLLKRRRQSA